VAHETLKAAQAAGIDWQALAFDNRTRDLEPERIRTLKHHPVRILSWFVRSEYYYGAKKHALDKAAARVLQRRGRPGYLATPKPMIFQGWSGECVRSLRACRRLGIASVLEIPTWHRHKGREKPQRLTKSERERAAKKGWEGAKNRMLVTRQQVLEEYDLADLILVLSEKAEETFLAAGIPKEKLFRHQRGVDVDRFTPAEKPPNIFRCVFVGSLIERKGVHHLLAAWRRLALPDAELVLVGTVHREMKRHIAREAGPTVRIPGFVGRVEDAYRSATVHVFPSECEGSAKSTYEAASCGLPQITTREAGDVVQDGVNGLIIPPNDPDALAAAIQRLFRDRELCSKMGAAGRERAVKHFTWGHFRARLMEAYRTLGKQVTGAAS
jgi:glycosyltransferase involved in cell wall biosynthesis